MAETTLGQIAYEAYVEVALDSDELIDWESMGEEVKEAWEAAANAVEAEIKRKHK